jgi:hypothetical protein
MTIWQPLRISLRVNLVYSQLSEIHRLACIPGCLYSCNRNRTAKRDATRPSDYDYEHRFAAGTEHEHDWADNHRKCDYIPDK